MTNFEKWKQEMTVEQAEDIFAYYGCPSCPARKMCVSNIGTDCIRADCKDAFEEWANLPAEGTNKPVDDKDKEIILRNLDEAIMSLNEAKNDIALLKKMLKEDNG